MRFKISEKDKAKEYIDSLKRSFRIETIKRKRSLNANNLYWAWMQLIAEETGNSKEDMHEYYLDVFAPRKQLIDRFVIIRTSAMNEAQMAKYMDSIKYHAFHELDIVLPEPDQAIDYYNDLVDKGVLA